MEDKELLAMDSIIKTLGDLDPDSKNRVLEYVFKRLNIKPQILNSSESEPNGTSVGNIQTVPLGQEKSGHLSQFKDILTLKNEKNPTSANQMVALVAYYLLEEAPLEDRKETINSEDIEKYFKQGRFNLPGRRAGDALSNAKNAGYLNKTSEVGEYRLNPVGYNLVANGFAQTQVRNGNKSKKKVSKK